MVITDRANSTIVTPDGIKTYDKYGNCIFSAGKFNCHGETGWVDYSWEPKIYNIEDLDIEKRGNENMRNEVIKLYADRKTKAINDKYKEIIEKEYNELEEVKRYNELVSTFETGLAELVDEFNREDYKPFVRTGYSLSNKYELDNYGLRDTIAEKYDGDKKKELSELENELKEINSMLSLSNDVAYQTEILERYGVLKKGKLTI